MRNVIYAINHTLDGRCDHTVTIADEELLDFHTDVMREVDLLAFGRKTYELMVPYWPEAAKSESSTTAEKRFAQKFDSIKKIVFSQTLGSVEGNARVVRAKPEDEIRRLKQENGKKILTGGVSIPSQLIARGLVDEFYFVVQPILAGEGRLLLDGIKLQERLRLKLLDSKTLKSGTIALHYEIVR